MELNFIFLLNRYEEEEEKKQEFESKRQYLLNRSKEKRAKDAEMTAKIK